MASKKPSSGKKGGSAGIFINLPVKDLDRAKGFFSALGYSFNPQFTDKNAACLIISEANGIYAMLLLEKFFSTFIKKEIADTEKSSEVILALSVESRQGVDELMGKVLAAGGTESREKQDYGWMYGRAFQDLDGHLWEIFYMDASKAPKTPEA